MARDSRRLRDVAGKPFALENGPGEISAQPQDKDPGEGCTQNAEKSSIHFPATLCIGKIRRNARKYRKTLSSSLFEKPYFGLFSAFA